MSTKIDKSNVASIVELNMVQQGMLFQFLTDLDPSLYNVQIAVNITGSFEPAALEQVLHRLQANHEVLRSVFRWEEVREPIQIILNNAALPYSYSDLSDESEGNAEAVLARFLEHDRTQKFDLNSLPIRFSLARLGAKRHVLVITHHHILYDGWSTGILLQEIFGNYRRLNSAQAMLGAAGVSYAKIQSAVFSKKGEEPAAYWRNYLQGYEPKMLFQAGRLPAQHQVPTVTRIVQKFSARRLKTFAASCAATPATIIYAAVGFLMRKYLNANDVMVGTVLSLRESSLQGVDSVMGNFINTLPLRLNETGDRSIAGVIDDLNLSLLERNCYAHTSYAEIKEIASLSPAESLFDAIVVIENYPLDLSAINGAGSPMVSLHSATERTEFPLVLNVFFKEDIEFEFIFKPAHATAFDPQSFAGHLTEVLNYIIEHKNDALASLNILKVNERDAILKGFNQTAKSFPEDDVIAAFQRQVNACPDKAAVTCDDFILTYSQLDELSGKIAGYLKNEKQVNKGDIVGVLLEREPYLVPVIYGILKAGAAYVPIDPGFPAERIDSIMRDSEMVALVSRGAHLSPQLSSIANIIDLDVAINPINEQQMVLVPVSGNDLVYVIYTSGSTGRPKGVMIGHGSLIDRIWWMQEKYPAGAADVFLLKTPIVFDISVWEIFCWSVAGASLAVLPHGGEKDPEIIKDAIGAHKVTVTHFVPSLLAVFLASLHTAADFYMLESLKIVFACGEALQPAHVEAFKQTLYNRDAVRLINLYGPAEATLDVSDYECAFEPSEAAIVPIGKPLANVELYILDSWGHPAPVGVTGELLIGGVGLAKGYINNETLTREKFVEKNDIICGRIYKTGDLARWMPDGNIEFLGRVDNQVKIRGLRIELGEIEHQVSAFNGIKECVVLSREHHGDNYLVAYCISPVAIDINQLEDFLRTRLPGYMIPAHFIFLEEFPLLISGKLNRKALPAPDMAGADIHEAANTPVEEKLVDIWAGVLHIDPHTISVTRSFFEMGGHSLKAISMVNEIYRQLQIRVPVKEIFEHADIRALACLLNKKEPGNRFVNITPAAPQSHYALSAAQERLYFLYRFDKHSTAYNGCLVTEIDGPLSYDRLNGAIKQLVKRHEVLRTVFELIDGKPVQKIDDDFEIAIERINAGDRDITAIVDTFIRPFNLNGKPPFRVGLVYIAPAKQVLLFDIHHIISDGLSQEIFIRDFSNLYNGLPLPALAFQFKDYALHLAKNEKSRIDAQKAYWLKVFEQLPEPLELPLDFERPLFNDFKAARYHFELDKHTGRQLEKFAGQHKTTVYNVLLAAFNILVAKVSGAEDITIGTPFAGRDYPGLENVAGMFVNTLALRTRVNAGDVFTALLAAVKDTAAGAFSNQLYPYHYIIDDLGLVRDNGRNPLFNILFSYQDFKAEQVAMEGLQVRSYGAGHQFTPFDLLLSVTTNATGLGCFFEFAADLFRADTIARFAGYWVNIVKAVLAQPQTVIAAIDYIAADEKILLTEVFNATGVVYPDESIVSLFKKSAQAWPGNTALIHAGGQLTYRQLDGRALAVARLLRAKLKGGGHRIGLLFEPGLDVSAAILGVLYAGFTFVPLSPQSPVERNSYILADSQVPLLLTSARLGAMANAIAGLAGSGIVYIDDVVMSNRAIRQQHVAAANLVYIIYTSGTTGQPKGVGVTHRSLVNYTLWNKEYHRRSAADHALQMVPYYFDGFGANFYPVLLSGAAMVTVPHENRLNIDLVLNIITGCRITNFAVLPSFYSEILDGMERSDVKVPDMRFVVLAGERANMKMLAKSQSILPRVNLQNEYGPTEATIAATHSRALNPAGNANIGSPISNTQIWVLGKHSDMLPVGVWGEICISGDGLAGGYMNNPGLSAHKFGPHPFMPGVTIYRTGDVGRWLPNGSLELRGRIDDQVKIRGHRIETREIENQLLNIAGIDEAIVVLFTHAGQQCLVAYYRAAVKLNEQDIRAGLAHWLPDYMLPAAFVCLAGFPYTSVGKIDKQRLPDPLFEGTGHIIMPCNDKEELLADAWKKVLGLKEISTNANFFTVGGDSIKSIQVCSALNASGYDLSVKDIFTWPTIKDLAQKLTIATAAPSQDKISHTAPLSPVQQWLFGSGLNNKSHFNQSVCISFNERITSMQVGEIFNKLSDHHDILRAKAVADGMAYTQVVSSDSVITGVEEHSLINHPDALAAMRQLGNQAQAGLDIYGGKNIKLLLFQLENESRLLIVIHHMVIDAVSWRILFEDIDNLLLQHKAGAALTLPFKTTPYTLWAEKIREQYVEKDKPFWNKFDNLNLKGLEKQDAEGANRVEDACTLKFSLDKELTQQLITQSHAAYNTRVNDILMAALALACGQVFGVNELLIDVESHGRDNVENLNVSRTVGWFTAFYPVHLNAGNGAIADAVINVKDALRRSPDFSHSYLLNRQAGALLGKADVCTSICFNYLGQFDNDISGKNFSVWYNNEPYQAIGLTENRFYEWEFLSMIARDELEMSFSFSSAQYDTEKMKLFLLAYQKCLTGIIAHCCAVTTPVITASDFSYKQLSAPELAQLPPLPQIEDVYTLSPMQEGLLFHALLEPERNFYFEQAAISLSGKLNRVFLDKTIQLLCSRYAVLRTVFRYRDLDRPVQIVLKECPVPVLFTDIAADGTGPVKDEIAGILATDKSKGFNLENGPLIRVHVISSGINEHVLVLSHHHILMDGWCLGIILKEFLAIYESLLCNHDPQLLPVKPYSGYIKWYESCNRGRSVSYWRNYLRDLGSLTGLPALPYLLPAAPAADLSVNELRLSEALTRNLYAAAREYGVTVSHIFQLAWGILLSKYNNTSDCIFGLVVAGRPAMVDGIDEMIGLFINTLPVRLKIDKNATIKAMLEQIRNDAADCGPHHYIPLQDIQGLAATNSSLFNHIIVFENYPVSAQIEEINGLPRADMFTISGSEFFEQTHYDLTVTIIPATEMVVKFKYKPTAVHPQIIENAAGHFAHVLAQLCAEKPSATLAGIKILSQAEEYAQLGEFNEVSSPALGASTVISHFAESALSYRFRTAQRSGDRQLTYGGLDTLSNRVAAYLRKKAGVRTGDIIGVLLDREERLLAVILGILKAGAAFVPMESRWPASRSNSVIRDSGMRVLVSTSALAAGVETGDGRMLDIDLEWNKIESSPGEAINHASQSGLAYVIYTSGSTGKPKGVMISHGSLYNYVSWANREYVQGRQSVFPLYSSIAFDLTITSIFTPLLSGNTIVLYEGAESGLQIDRILSDNLSTVLKLTPSHLKLIRDNYSRRELQGSKLETLIIGGEDLESSLARAIDELFEGRVALYNEYGPTEATVGCMIYRYDAADGYSSVPIGKPGAGVRIYVLDSDQQPAAIGAGGELYIAGKGLAQGYLNNETLTKEKFIADPFKAGELMYRTGDVAVATVEGTLLYKGRKDGQVQLRGFRIELAEVSGVLERAGGVKEAHVRLWADKGEDYLVAYYTGDAAVAGLKQEAGRHLPEYMHPSYYVQLESFPLTVNGKLAWEKLPAPELTAQAGDVPPEGETEETLAAIWSGVLQLDEGMIGATRSFFELGGNSLKAVSLVNQVRKATGAELQLKEIFREPTIRGQGALVAQRGNAAGRGNIPVAGVKPYYQLSSAQKRMYLLHQFDKSSLAYNMPNVFLMKGKADVGRLETAFCGLLNRHDILRTNFERLGDSAVQIPGGACREFRIAEQRCAVTAVQACIRSLVRPFDLGSDRLLRAGIIHVDSGEELLVIDLHHIITDGLSQRILIRDFIELYGGKAMAKPELQYKDYAEWQQRSGQGQEAKAWWQAQFADEIPVLELPLDYPRPQVKDHKGSALSFGLDEEETAGIKALAAATGSTVFMVLLSCWNILLSRLSGQADVVTGTPSGGREHAGLEEMAGMFVNTLALRSEVKGTQSLRGYVEEVTASTLEAFGHQGYQYEELVDTLKVERDTGRNPLFDVMFVYQDYDSGKLSVPGLELSAYAQAHTISKFDLLLSCRENGGALSFELEYASSLFRAESISRYAGCFRHIARSLVANPEQQICEVQLLDESEQQAITAGYNRTDKSYPAGSNVMELFRARARQHPAAAAVNYGGNRLSYGELDELSDKYAAYLQEERQVSKGELIGLLLEREAQLIPAIYGILKAGCAYVPIDPHYPSDRIVTILEDSGIRQVVSRGKHINAAIATKASYIDLDEALEEIESKQSRPAIAIAGTDLAYVIYTSGSTGKPKGVMIEHHSVVNRLLWMQREYPLGMSDVLLQKTPVVFDVSVWELFWWSLAGASLYVLQPGEEKEARRLQEIISREQVSTIHFVPAMLSHFLQEQEQEEQGGSGYSLASLRQVFTSGEALQYGHAAAFGRRVNSRYGTRLINLYGPTEATVDVSCYECDYGRALPQPIPIGRPIDNTRLYILDKYGNVCPVGVAGELCIAGAGLARGYLNNAELTAKKFTTGGRVIRERLYHTGDLARWQGDGNIEYMGRIDSQVKLRGLRIELEEIQVHLSGYPGISDSVVVLKEQSGEQALVAYYISGAEIAAEALRKHLGGKLPVYMVPGYFVQLEAWPVTVNGKLNRKGLPDPEIGRTGSYTAAETGTEQLLVSLWAEVLKLDAAVIGIHQSFFELGGNSLRAMTMARLIRDRFYVDLKISDIFIEKTIYGLSRLIADKEMSVINEIRRVDDREYYPASVEQQRIYFEQLLNPEGLGFNISGAFEISPDTTIERLELTFARLCDRHEILRTGFIQDEEQLLQVIKPQAQFGLVYHHLKPHETYDELYLKFKRPFSLLADSFFRAEVIVKDNRPVLVMMDIHHIICDGFSLNILTRDLFNLFDGINLPLPNIRYVDYAVWQYRNSDRLAMQRDYWQTILSLPVTPLMLPRNDYAFGSVDTAPAASTGLVIDGAEHQMIKKLLNEQQLTDFTFLLSVYCLLLHKVTGNTDIIIGSDVSGRTQECLKNVAGSFTNLLPLRIAVSPQLTYLDFLDSVKQTVIAGLDNQEFPFDEMVMLYKANSPGNLSPLIEAHFAFANFIEPATKWGAGKLKAISIKQAMATQYEFKIEASEKDEAYRLNFIYSKALFDAGFISALTGYYHSILKAVLADPLSTIECIDLQYAASVLQ